MRVLYISYVNILSTGGAPIEARKICSALQTAKYRIPDFDFRVVSLDGNLPESLQNVQLVYQKKDAIISRLLWHSYYMYCFWKREKEKILNYKPDVVILGRSNLGFIARDIKLSHPDVIVITDVDNIEVDYINAWDGSKAKLLHKLSHFQLVMSTRRDEKDCIAFSDWCLFLTNRNYHRAKELYRYKSANFTVLPICIQAPKEVLHIKDKRSVAIYGTLDYEPNHRAAMEFISKVWIPHFLSDSNVQLIIAGKNPRDELVELIKGLSNVKVFSGFRSLPDILPMETIAIAPLQSGAGMKTKIAEALSYGMAVIGSDEAWVGYEAIEEAAGVWHANSAEEYVELIGQFFNMSTSELRKIQKKNRELYQKNYSLDVSNKVIIDLLLSKLRSRWLPLR